MATSHWQQSDLVKHILCCIFSYSLSSFPFATLKFRVLHYDDQYSSICLLQKNVRQSWIGGYHEMLATLTLRTIVDT
jgi:hypothetical protein